jgi:enoyl-CoA hydratase/carnithine racemase
MTTSTIRIDRADKIATLIMTRPERRNAFDETMFDQLEAATLTLEKDMPRAIIITGDGDKAFSAGFDVNPDNPMAKKVLESVTEKTEGPARAAFTRLREVVDRFVGLPVPVIAAINGLAYGGGAELASRCDLRVMDERAVICLSEATLGLMPDWGGGPALARLVGHARAMDLILTARKVEAREALALGFANRVTPPGRSLEEARTMALQIADYGRARAALPLGFRIPGT